MQITKSSQINTSLPSLRLGHLLAEVKVAPSAPPLLQLIQEQSILMQSQMQMTDIHSIATIQATRDAYKTLGKEPSRYRPSAEALTRRILQGKGLYQVNNLVDLLNLVSITTGFSIGGYDYSKIKGAVEIGVGQADEPYTAIGRGSLNIENLPLCRDELGAFGSPTSDSQRTMVTDKTTQFLMVFFDFDGLGNLNSAMDLATNLLAQHTHGSAIIERAIH